MRCPLATWDPVSAPGVPYTSPVRKIVHHRTQVAGRCSTASLYPQGGKDAPHFTVDEWSIRQHFDTSVGSRALVNAPGGVETNSDGVIQIEIVGYSGVSMPGPTADNLIQLLGWIAWTHPVPWVWPNGRPKPAAPGPSDPGGHVRSTAAWAGAGHFDHGSVPENEHWDPAYTDLEWFVLNGAMTPVATATVLANTKVVPMFNPPLSGIVDTVCAVDGKGGWSVGSDGAIYTFGPAQYLGGANGKDYFAGRHAARLEATPAGYVIVATSGERYSYP